MIVNRLVLIIGLALPWAICCVAQERANTPPWLPSGSPDSVVDFSQICIAKLSQDEQSLLIAKPALNFENRTRTEQVTKYVTESRTRTKTTAGGQTVTEEYQVAIPVTEQIEKSYTVRVPAGVTKFTLPIATVRAWELTGAPIDAGSLAERLSKPTYVIASENDPRANFPGVEPFYASILRPDTIVIYVAPRALTVEAPLPPGFSAPSAPGVLQPAPGTPVPVPAPAAPAPVVDPSA